ncbi:MAG: metal-dependent hydrolase [Candidatus Micrarchaeia archaeon]
MKTGFTVHLLSGFLLFLLFTILFGAPGWMAGVAFIIGAVLPDLDSPVSKPRRAARWILLLVFLSLLLLFYPSLAEVCAELKFGWCGYLPFLLILFVFLAVEVVDALIPGHRGFLHTLPAAALYGCIVSFAVFYFGVNLAGSIRAGGWAFLGYASHIAVDLIGDAIPFK